MGEFELKRQTALDGMHKTFGATVMRELDDLRIAIRALPASAAEEMRQALDTELGCALPGPGQAALSRNSGTHVLRLGADRLMILSLPAPPVGADLAAPTPNGPDREVDQSDYWVTIELAGPLVVAALERSCRLDLDARVFSPGRFARTPLGGVSTLLLRLSPDRFLALAPRSFARSLAHTFETSLCHVQP